MNGAEGAKDIILGYLQPRIEGVLTWARHDPVLNAQHSFPAVHVTVHSVESARYDGDPILNLWQFDYRIRVWCFVRGDSFDGTTNARDALILAVRSLLLAQPSLAAEVAARVNTASLRENYIDALVDTSAARTLAGGFVEFLLTVEEQVDDGYDRYTIVLGESLVDILDEEPILVEEVP
jgi:hypothetical protein